MVPAAPPLTVSLVMCALSGAGASGQLSMDKMVLVRYITSPLPLFEENAASNQFYSQGSSAPGGGIAGQCVTSADCASRVPYCSKLGFCHGGR